MLAKNLIDLLNEKTQNFINECKKEQQDLYFFKEGMKNIEHTLEELANQYETATAQEKNILLPSIIKWQEKYQDYIKECRLIKIQLENRGWNPKKSTEENEKSFDNSKKYQWLIGLVTSFNELINNLVLNKESLIEDIAKLNRIYPGINKLYQELFETQENLVDPKDIPEKCSANMDLESYRNYVVHFLVVKGKERGSLINFVKENKKEEKPLVVEPVKEEENMEEKKEENEKTYQLRNEINTLLETGKPITENLFKEYNETIEGPQKKEESSKGKVYRWVKNASAKIKQEVLAKRKSIATAALVSLMGIAVIATPGKEKETNPTFIAQTPTTIDKTTPIEVEVHDEDKNLFNKTCTLKNYNIYAYTDQYVGLDGEPTQRIPLYPPDMPRTILRVFMDVPVQGLIEVHSDEEINYYLEIGGQVRSIYTSDACFYQISDVNMKRTEEMKR